LTAEQEITLTAPSYLVVVQIYYIELRQVLCDSHQIVTGLHLLQQRTLVMYDLAACLTLDILEMIRNWESEKAMFLSMQEQVVVDLETGQEVLH